MTRRRRAWIWSAAAVFFVSLFLVHARFTNIILFPPVEPISSMPDSYGLPWSSEVISVRLPHDIVTVHCWEIQTGAVDNPWIILLHGRGRNRSAVLKYAPWLHSAGFNLFLFDFPGHGESGFSPITLGAFEKESVKAAVHHLATRGAKRIGVMGISMGGASGILAAAEDPRIATVIADSVYSSFVGIVADRAWADYHIPKFPLVYTVSGYAGLMYRFNPFVVDIGNAANAVSPRPMLFIHSETDGYIPIKHMETIQKAIKEKAEKYKNIEFWTFRSAKHDSVFDVTPQEYKKRVLDFLAKNFPAHN